MSLTSDYFTQLCLPAVMYDWLKLVVKRWVDHVSLFTSSKVQHHRLNSQVTYFSRRGLFPSNRKLSFLHWLCCHRVRFLIADDYLSSNAELIEYLISIMRNPGFYGNLHRHSRCITKTNILRQIFSFFLCATLKLC